MFRLLFLARSWVMLALCLLALHVAKPAEAQSLSAGDIAFTAYVSDGPDVFAFVLLTDIPAGTSINFGDDGWSNYWNGLYQLLDPLVWTSDTPLSAGTQVVIDLGNVTTSTGTLSGYLFGLSNWGDVLLAYQGSKTNPTLLAVMNMNGGWRDPDDFFNSSRNSNLPPGMIEQDTAFIITPERDNAWLSNCAVTTGQKDALRLAIHNPANWSTDNSRNAVPSTLPCTITVVPPMGCNNGIIEGAEVCDGSALGGATCQSLGFDAGTVACLGDCTYDTSGCSYTCGNNSTDGPELCDGSDLVGTDCTNFGFDGGTLICNSDCSDFSTGSCTYMCGNDSADGAEVCDGMDLKTETC